jgi:SAM-dependent methyltransferase
MTAKADSERFHSGANQYAVYLETPEGRLRTDLAFANLEDFLPRSQAEKSLCALDVGCGTGATAVRLARLGMQVTLLDSSRAMLDIAKRAAQEAGVTEKVLLQHGDAAQLANVLHTRSYDVILCHNILEYCDDRVRLFTSDRLRAMLTEASLAAIAERGVRILADYLPPRVSRSADYERIFELERKLGSRPEYAAVARYTQCVARCVNSVAEDGP